MIEISLCMIVKNEAKVLARCLDSLAGLMDEIIIVDTGSTDRTKEIAKKYTTHIYDYQWIDDFAHARNFSFSKATKDYIYCADADEVLDEENRERFLQLKQVLLPEVEIVQMYYCNQLQYNTVYNYDKEYRPKLYKRIRTFEFMDPIHEVVRLDPIVYDSEIEILHLPTSSHGARDFAGFERMVKENIHLSKRLHSMYAKELYITGNDDDIERAMPYFLESVEDESRTMDEIREALCVIVRGARLTKDRELFFKYAMRGAASDPCSELCCELGDYYMDRQDDNEAALWYLNAAYETESILNCTYHEIYPLEQLLKCYQKAGNEEAAEEIRRQIEANKEACE